MSETVWMAESGMVHIDPDGRMCPVLAMVVKESGLEFDGGVTANVSVVVLRDGKLAHVDEGRIAYPGDRSPEFQYACATNGVEMPRMRKGRREQRPQAAPSIFPSNETTQVLPEQRVEGRAADLFANEPAAPPDARIKWTPLRDAPTYEQMQAEALRKGSGPITGPQEPVSE